MDSSYLFIKSDDYRISDMPETDKLYHQWGFVNTIFWGSDIRAVRQVKYE